MAWFIFNKLCVAPTPAGVSVTFIDNSSYPYNNLAVSLTIFLWSDNFLSFVLYRFRSLRTYSNLLVLNLTIADFLLSVGNVPAFVAASIYGYWVFGALGNVEQALDIVKLLRLTSFLLISLKTYLVIVWYTCTKNILFFNCLNV